MLRRIGKAGSALIDALLPGTKAEACTDSWCEKRSGVNQHRCCKLCTGGVKACTSWTSGSCAGVVCPR
ncbi:hypothetical protein Rhe02_36400 [Rhizocola hellebori]|uniref:Uncharacterized protein n=1 Tax=Rhizocola hellebori TaxID=1392758 RepID=A0A8J3Q9A7_9ACTN|nr:hypothetical protein [Rhizocola hellebori]GIH05573.1 hypothetical protein Rhe02_36400 [Rhizocola hellebori]